MEKHEGLNTMATNWLNIGKKAAREGITLASQAVAGSAEILEAVSKELRTLGDQFEKQAAKVDVEPKAAPETAPSEAAPQAARA